ncbi:unnamed protein product [Clavelina lepadiformis]|uniref:Heme-binding protein 2 n=1 Tax=Clavelina lepadiformis TaxID=159417 RepID=A0ABP0GTC8_CLALP
MSTAQYNGYDQPHWELTGTQPKDKSYEVRKYPRAVWTSTDQTAPNKGSSSSFRRLADYIGGVNAKNEKISMTVPVIQQIPNLSNQLQNATRKMMFYVPHQHQISPPKPTHPQVQNEVMEETVAFVRRFGGYAKTNDWQREASLLYDSLMKNGVKDTMVDKSVIYAVSYNSPYRPVFRHNEVWLLLDKGVVNEQ